MTNAALTATDADTQIQKQRQKALQMVFGEKFGSNFQSPVVFIDNAELQSPASTRFFRKDFAYLSKQLFLEYQYRSWRGFNPETLEKYNEVITKKLASINTLMTSNISRLEKLLQQNGVKMETSLYPNPVHMTVPVIAAHARSYFKLLTDLDKVNLMAGTANLLGVIDSAQRAEVEFLCKKAVRAFRAILQTEVVKLYREADRLIKEQQTSGTVNPEMADVVSQQGKDIAAFSASESEGADADSSMDLGGADPSKVIDDAAAAAVAAAGKSKGKAPKAKEVDPAAVAA